MTLAGFAAKNAFRNKRRTTLTVLSIAVSLLLLTLLMVVWRAFYIDQGTPSDARRLVTRNRVSLTFLLPAFYEQKIRALPGVVAVAPSNWFGGIYKDNKPENFFGQFGTNPADLLKVYPDFKIPPEQAAAWVKDRAGCIVDSRLAAAHHWNVGDHLFIKGSIFPVTLDLTVDGIFVSPVAFQSIYFNQEYVNQALPFMANLDDTFIVLTASPRDATRVADAIDAMFRDSPQPTRTETAKSFTLDFINMLGNIKAFMLAIASAVVFAILLVSANTMAMSVRERIREIAVLKTLGFPKNSILALLIGEAVTVTLLGGLIGVFLASLLLFGAAHGPAGQMLGNLRVTPGVFSLALVAAALVGILSGLLPSWRAASQPVVQGLRHVG